MVRRLSIRLIKSRQGQSIFELALLIGVVVTALLTIQTYVRRSLQARIHNATPSWSVSRGGVLVQEPMQYEPYYLQAPDATKVVSNAQVSVKTFGDYHVAPAGMTGNFTSETTQQPGAFQDEYPPRP